jgi:hypothetical protein
MSNQESNPTAFPTGDGESKGMTLRDYFAAEALNAIIQNQGSKETPAKRTEQAFIAFQYADEMLRHRLDPIGFVDSRHENPGPED